MSRHFFRPVDAHSLAAFRTAFGTLMVGVVIRYFAYGWVDALFIRPSVRFPYEGFEWVSPLPGSWMYVGFAALGVLAALIAVGVWTRVGAAFFCAGFTYLHLIDKANYLNHYYLVFLLAFLLAIFPSGRVWSVDSRRQPNIPAQIPLGAIWLLRFQLRIVYFFAGLAKLNGDWLWSAQPLRIWLPMHADLPIVGPLLEERWLAYAASWAAALFDLSVPFLLLCRRTRGWAYGAVLFFHLLTALLFPIGLFPWLMAGLTPIFFEPDWPARLLRRSKSTFDGVRPMDVVSPGWKRAIILTGAVAYFGIQLAQPMQSFASEGNVLWNENGFRFSWRVMLIEKYGSVYFLLTYPETGQAIDVDPSEYPTAQQVRMMSTQPDMILWFAHWLARRQKNGPNVSRFAPSRWLRSMADRANH